MTASRPYISAKFGGNVCISGSPATIARLSDNPAFRDMVLTPLQVPGAFHAPHLYSSNDVDAIVSPCGTIVDELRSQLTLLSASSGERVEAASYRHLLQEAVNDVLTRQYVFPNHIFFSMVHESRGLTIAQASMGSCSASQFQHIQCAHPCRNSPLFGVPLQSFIHTRGGWHQDQVTAAKQFGTWGRCPNIPAPTRWQYLTLQDCHYRLRRALPQRHICRRAVGQCVVSWFGYASANTC